MWLIWLFLFICFLFGLFHLFTKKYLNPYKLTMIFGKKGSGKSTYLTKLAYQYSKKGYTVYSNMYTPFSVLIDVKCIGYCKFLPNSCLLIDEVGLIWDSRDFKTFDKNVNKFFKYQRKMKLRIFLFSQSFDIDKKIRDLTDDMYLMSNFFRVFTKIRRIKKFITVSDPSASEQGALVESYQFSPIFSYGGISFNFIPRWSKYFDTNEGIEDMPTYDEWIANTVNANVCNTNIKFCLPKKDS